jgi:hypothetical protein
MLRSICFLCIVLLALAAAAPAMAANVTITWVPILNCNQYSIGAKADGPKLLKFESGKMFVLYDVHKIANDSKHGFFFSTGSIRVDVPPGASAAKSENVGEVRLLQPGATATGHLLVFRVDTLNPPNDLRPLVYKETISANTQHHLKVAMVKDPWGPAPKHKKVCYADDVIAARNSEKPK